MQMEMGRGGVFLFQVRGGLTGPVGNQLPALSFT